MSCPTVMAILVDNRRETAARVQEFQKSRSKGISINSKLALLFLTSN